MLTFSAKALRLIEAAVAEFAEPSQRECWRIWQEKHPELRRRGQQWDDWGRSHLPQDIAAIASLALDRWARRLRDRRSSADLSDDDISDLDNELSYVQSVEKFLAMVPVKRTQQRVG